jgi:2-amino-4-hydroxy-6-hydroxymethyldihydropteridine diphosphokinase
VGRHRGDLSHGAPLKIVIGLGGNLGTVRETFRHALLDLESHEGIRILRRSGLWTTEAVGPPQPDYLNAAVLVESTLPPRRLLDLCQAIEARHGRDRRREQRWGPRTLDLDLLVADGVVCRGPKLELPHPRLAERAFALEPAAEVAPDLIHPTAGASLADLAAGVRSEALPTVR